MQTSSHASKSLSSPASRYAKPVELSKRVRFDIDRDVFRGRGFDFGTKFLPGQHVGRRRAPVPDARRAPLPVAGRRTHIRQHVRPGRAIHRREDARRQPRPLARRPARRRGARPLHRRGAQAPGTVSPARADGGQRNARGLSVRPRSECRRVRRARQVDVGRARAHLPYRSVRARTLPAEHRPIPPCRRCSRT